MCELYVRCGHTSFQYQKCGGGLHLEGIAPGVCGEEQRRGGHVALLESSGVTTRDGVTLLMF